MPHIELLYDDLQSHNANSYSTSLGLYNFYKVISTIRDEIRSSKSEDIKESIQMKKWRHNEDLTAIVKEIYDTIIFQAKEWFKFSGHLSAAKLVLQKNF